MGSSFLKRPAPTVASTCTVLPNRCAHRLSRSSFSLPPSAALVDLAGSEDVGRSGAVGTVLAEAQKINASLLALGNVIHSLTHAKGRATHVHVPYRDSALTRMLQQSLGGNCKTTLLCCCSPADGDVTETLSTLRFAARAKLVQNSAKAHVKVDVSDDASKELVAQLQVRLEELTKVLKVSRGRAEHATARALQMGLKLAATRRRETEEAEAKAAAEMAYIAKEKSDIARSRAELEVSAQVKGSQVKGSANQRLTGKSQMANRLRVVSAMVKANTVEADQLGLNGEARRLAASGAKEQAAMQAAILEKDAAMRSAKVEADRVKAEAAHAIGAAQKEVAEALKARDAANARAVETVAALNAETKVAIEALEAEVKAEAAEAIEAVQTELAEANARAAETAKKVEAEMKAEAALAIQAAQTEVVEAQRARDVANARAAEAVASLDSETKVAIEASQSEKKMPCHLALKAANAEKEAAVAAVNVAMATALASASAEMESMREMHNAEKDAAVTAAHAEAEVAIEAAKAEAAAAVEAARVEMESAAKAHAGSGQAGSSKAAPQVDSEVMQQLLSEIHGLREEVAQAKGVSATALKAAAGDDSELMQQLLAEMHGLRSEVEQARGRADALRLEGCALL